MEINDRLYDIILDYAIGNSYEMITTYAEHYKRKNYITLLKYM